MGGRFHCQLLEKNLHSILRSWTSKLLERKTQMNSEEIIDDFPVITIVKNNMVKRYQVDDPFNIGTQMRQIHLGPFYSDPLDSPDEASTQDISGFQLDENTPKKRTKFGRCFGLLFRSRDNFQNPNQSRTTSKRSRSKTPSISTTSKNTRLSAVSKL